VPKESKRLVQASWLKRRPERQKAALDNDVLSLRYKPSKPTKQANMSQKIEEMKGLQVRISLTIRLLITTKYPCCNSKGPFQKMETRPTTHKFHRKNPKVI
jgi:hypothetical protein